MKRGCPASDAQANAGELAGRGVPHGRGYRRHCLINCCVPKLVSVLRRPLPDVPAIPPDALLTPRGREALAAWLYVRAGVSERELAEALGISVARVRRRLSYAQTRIWDRLVRGDDDRCLVCGDELAIDHRQDALYCQRSSTCRSKMSRRGISVRRSYGGRWTTTRGRDFARLARFELARWLSANALEPTKPTLRDQPDAEVAPRGLNPRALPRAGRAASDDVRPPVRPSRAHSNMCK